MTHTFKCRDCGTDNETENSSVKVCKKCKLNHDGMTNEEATAYAESLAAKVAEAQEEPEGEGKANKGKGKSKS